MPYYRIVIWTKRKKLPFKGIRLMGEHNINAVYNSVLGKARQIYQNDFIDVEVQLLSKLCAAVKKYETKKVGNGK